MFLSVDRLIYMYIYIFKPILSKELLWLPSVLMKIWHTLWKVRQFANIVAFHFVHRPKPRSITLRSQSRAPFRSRDNKLRDKIALTFRTISLATGQFRNRRVCLFILAETRIKRPYIRTRAIFDRVVLLILLQTSNKLYTSPYSRALILRYSL